MSQLIIVTASEDHASRAVREGAALALTKPVAKDTLVSAVNALKLSAT